MTNILDWQKQMIEEVFIKKPEFKELFITETVSSDNVLIDTLSNQTGFRAKWLQDNFQTVCEIAKNIKWEIMKLQHIQLLDYNIIVSDEEIKEGDLLIDLRPLQYGKIYTSIGFSNTQGYVGWIKCNTGIILSQKDNQCKKIIASTNLAHNLPSIDYNEFEEEFDVIDNVWSLGNEISVTTIYDYEERKDFPNHNEYENKGKRTYVGEVIEVDKGLALKTIDGKIFKTQGSYWFGSILSQDCKLIKKVDSSSEKRFSERDMFNCFKAGQDYEREGIILHPNAHGYIKSLQKTEITNIQVEMYYLNLDEIRERSKGFLNVENKIPKVTNNKIKITKIL